MDPPSQKNKIDCNRKNRPTATQKYYGLTATKMSEILKINRQLFRKEKK
jgi:hypothetical protein